MREFAPVSRPTPEERRWVQDKLKEIEAANIPLKPAGIPSAEDIKWFRRYIKENTGPVEKTAWKPIEKQWGFRLPKSYKDFIDKIGPQSFDDVDGLEGFRANIFPPSQLDRKSHLFAELNPDEDETHAINPIMFADTEHGDCFCFDVRPDRLEFEVLLYQHEGHFFEPFTPNFPAFIRRLGGI